MSGSRKGLAGVARAMGVRGITSLTGGLSLLLASAVLVVQVDARERLDAIAAIVDDDVVLVSELAERMEAIIERMQDDGAQVPDQEVLVTQLMERLIVESIQLQKAEQRGVKIDDEALTRAVQSFAANNNMEFDEFRIALERDGMSYAQFREDVRRELTINRLQRVLVNRRVLVTEQEIADLIQSPFFQEMLSDEYRVGHILLPLDSGASEEATQEALAAAEQAVAELRSGGDFAQMAIAKSGDARALEGGDLGWLRAGELPSLFAEMVTKLQVGDVADPLRSGSGFHIVKLVDRRGASTQKAEQTNLRHILVKPSAIRDEAATEALIRDIRAQIVAGADFAELAKEHSEDPGSGLAGGDLGWSTGEEYVETFKRVMAGTGTGELSAPFRSEYGWHIMEVLGRRTEDMSEEARNNLALTFLHRRRFEEELQSWLKEIRDEAFIEMRI